MGWYKLYWRWQVWWLCIWPDQVSDQVYLEVMLLGLGELLPLLIGDEEISGSVVLLEVELPAYQSIEK